LGKSAILTFGTSSCTRVGHWHFSCAIPTRLLGETEGHRLSPCAWCRRIWTASKPRAIASAFFHHVQMTGRPQARMCSFPLTTSSVGRNLPEKSWELMHDVRRWRRRRDLRFFDGLCGHRAVCATQRVLMLASLRQFNLPIGQVRGECRSTGPAGFDAIICDETPPPPDLCGLDASRAPLVGDLPQIMEGACDLKCAKRLILNVRLIVHSGKASD